MVVPSRWCCLSHLNDATIVTKPETWESSLASPSVTHTQLVTMSGKVSSSPLLRTVPSSSPAWLQATSFPIRVTARLPDRFSSCSLAPTHLIFHTAARRMGLFHKSRQGTPALAQFFPSFLSPERKLRTQKIVKTLCSVVRLAFGPTFSPSGALPLDKFLHVTGLHVPCL